MPSLKHFYLYDSKLDTAIIDKLPYAVTFDDIWMEISYTDGNYTISGNTEFRINNQPSRRAPVHNNDLISFKDEFMIFTKEKEKDADIFIGKLRTGEKENKHFVFKLPRKISKQDFEVITGVMESDPEEKEVYIDTSTAQFMDSDAIQNMLHLVQRMKNKKISCWFYKPSSKFITYLKLANIEKLIPVKRTKNEQIEYFIENRQASLRKEKGKARFILTDNLHNFVVEPETVSLVGRIRTPHGILIPDNEVSREHALLVNKDNSLYLIDRDSTNYSYVNGWQVTPYCLHPLKVNDILYFGKNSHFKVKQI